MKTVVHAYIAIIVLLSVGCKETPPAPDDGVDHDVITTFEMTLIKNQAPRDTIVVVWQDVDGPGGDGPDQIDTLFLDSGKTYYTTIRVLNATITPAEDLTQTIRDEKNNHQFFYTFAPTTLGVLTILDKDANDHPVGLSLDISATSKGAGELGITLSHWADSRDKDGVTPSDETDLSIIYPTVVK